MLLLGLLCPVIEAPPNHSGADAAKLCRLASSHAGQ